VYQESRTRADGSILTTWVATVEVGRDPRTGQRLRRKIKGRTKTEVLRRAGELRRQVEGGAARSGGTVAELARWWLGSVVPAKVESANTIAGYRQIVECHIVPVLGAVPVARLSPEQVDAWLAARSHLSRTYLGRLRSTLAQVLREAERRGQVVRNVALLSVMPKTEPAKGRRSLTPTEAAALLEAATGERLEAALVVGLAVGLRPGEISGLLWGDLDLDAVPPTLAVTGMVKRRPEDGSVWRDNEPKKARASRRTVALPPAAVEALRDHRRRQAAERLALGDAWSDEGLVFPSEIGTPLDPSNVRRTFRRIAKRAGIAEGFPYLLRHSGASLMLHQGATIEDVADVLGDDPVTLLRHYRHQVRPVAEAALRMDAILRGAGT